MSLAILIDAFFGLSLTWLAYCFMRINEMKRSKVKNVAIFDLGFLEWAGSGTFAMMMVSFPGAFPFIHVFMSGDARGYWFVLLVPYIYAIYYVLGSVPEMLDELKLRKSVHYITSMYKYDWFTYKVCYKQCKENGMVILPLAWFIHEVVGLAEKEEEEKGKPTERHVKMVFEKMNTTFTQKKLYEAAARRLTQHDSANYVYIKQMMNK